MRCLIFCGGESRRWEHSTPKHLIPINGEPLLERTVRQFRKHDYDVTLVSDNSQYIQYAPVYAFHVKKGLLEHILHSNVLWSEDKTVSH